MSVPQTGSVRLLATGIAIKMDVVNFIDVTNK
jgi:hypothetical protein